MSGKNLRLTFPVWQELRYVKFKSKQPDYTAVLKMLLKENKGKQGLSDDVRGKSPTDQGDDTSLNVPKSDKTIFISEEIHNALHDLKNEYVMHRGYATRGPKAVSVSDILMDLLLQFKERHKI